MRNLVLGTAGHIDHGKTALVKALTGIDTDRLQEEKAQGISIVSGFAHLTLSSGQVLEIVDVPGHEKLVKNMYRGISGVDIAIMVIAADDGVMPQTKEHLNILNLLEIEKGLVVVTKVDLVDDELIILALDEIENMLKGTFLENCPILCVSNKTGKGIGEVKTALEELSRSSLEEADQRAFRLPVDRVFTMTGYGRVATGTIASGTVKEADELQVFPSGRKVKVRTIQVHKQQVKEAGAGQRVGLNFSNIDAEVVERGMVLSTPNALKPTYLINASLHYLKSNKKPFQNRKSVRLHSGTSEAAARVVLMEGNEILPGETKYVQLRLDRELVPLPFDKYIIRSLSPKATIGGGTILEIARKKYRAHNPETIRYLHTMENGSVLHVVEAIAKRNTYQSLTMEDLSMRIRTKKEKILEAIEKLKIKGKLIQVEEERVFHRDAFKYLRRRVVEVVKECYKNNPRQRNLAKDRVRSLVDESLSPQVFELVIQELSSKQILEAKKEGLRLKGSSLKLTAKECKIVEELGKRSDCVGFRPVRVGELAEALDFCNEKDIEAVLKFLLSEGKFVRLRDGSFMECEKFERAKQVVVQFISDNKQATVIEIRDLVKGGRRGTISLLEHLDSEKITERIGDYRVLRRN